MTNNFIKIDEGKIEARLDVLFYQEDGVILAYAPALDIVGYDHDIEGAKKSFEIVLEEYLKYGLANNTLEADLIEHGWVKKEKEFDSPLFWLIVKKNKQLQGVLNNNFTKEAHEFTYSVC